MKVLVAQSCLTLCDPIDCNPPGSSVYGILQARILEWVARPFSRGSPRPRDQTQVSCIAGRFFTVLVTREAIPSPCSFGVSGFSKLVLLFIFRGGRRDVMGAQEKKVVGPCGGKSAMNMEGGAG